MEPVASLRAGDRMGGRLIWRGNDQLMQSGSDLGPPPTPSSTWRARSQDGSSNHMRSSARSEGEEQEWFATESIRPGDEQRHQDRGELGDEERAPNSPRWKVEVGRRS